MSEQADEQASTQQVDRSDSVAPTHDQQRTAVLGDLCEEQWETALQVLETHLETYRLEAFEAFCDNHLDVMFQGKKSRQDILKGYVRWSRKLDEEQGERKVNKSTLSTIQGWFSTEPRESACENNNTDGRVPRTQLYNVSRALRRLVALDLFLQQNQAALFSEQDMMAFEAWRKELIELGIVTSPHLQPETNRRVLFLDVNRLLERVRTYSAEKSANRLLLVSFGLFLSLGMDTVSTEQGLLVIETLRNTSLVSILSLIPREANSKIRQLTYGCLAVKVKGVYLIDPPMWLSAFMRLVSVFLSTKLLGRFSVLTGPEGSKQMIEGLGGSDKVVNWQAFDGQLEPGPGHLDWI